MNTNTKIGLSGLAAAFTTNVVLRLISDEIFPAFFSSGWWSMWFPIYAVMLIFVIVGVATRGGNDE